MFHLYYPTVDNQDLNSNDDNYRPTRPVVIQRPSPGIRPSSQRPTFQEETEDYYDYDYHSSRPFGDEPYKPSRGKRCKPFHKRSNSGRLWKLV